MNKVDFLSSHELEILVVNRKKSVDGKKINWFKIQNIIYIPKKPYMLYVREYSPEKAPILSISLKKTTDESKLTQLAKLNLLYENGRKISKAKYDDLQSLLQYIPSEYHEFYNSLKYTDDEMLNDYALANRQSSDEEEYDDI